MIDCFPHPLVEVSVEGQNEVGLAVGTEQDASGYTWMRPDEARRVAAALSAAADAAADAAAVNLCPACGATDCTPATCPGGG